MRKEGFCQFFPKIFNFKVLWFFEKENFVASTWQIRRLFGIEIIKIYLIGSNVPIFENRHKVLNHSTLFQMEWGAKKEGHSLITFIPLFWSDQTANSVSPFHLLTALFFVYIESYFLNPPTECKVFNFSSKVKEKKYFLEIKPVKISYNCWFS